MKIFGENQLPRIHDTDGKLKHIFREGSREHVTWWDSNGRHCSEPECEINHRSQKENGI